MARKITGRARTVNTGSSVIYSKSVDVSDSPLTRKIRYRPFLRVPKQGLRGKRLNRNKKSAGGMGG